MISSGPELVFTPLAVACMHRREIAPETVELRLRSELAEAGTTVEEFYLHVLQFTGLELLALALDDGTVRLDVCEWEEMEESMTLPDGSISKGWSMPRPASED